MRAVTSLVLSLICSISSAGADLQSLLQNSPFGRGTAEVAPVPETAGTLEFRGLSTEGDRTFFSIRDVQTERSYWLQLGEEGPGFVLAGFNPERATLSLVRAGRRHEVALSCGEANARPTAAPTELTGTAVSIPTSDRQRRVQEEVRRRREAKKADANSP